MNHEHIERIPLKMIEWNSFIIFRLWRYTTLLFTNLQITEYDETHIKVNKLFLTLDIKILYYIQIPFKWKAICFMLENVFRLS